MSHDPWAVPDRDPTADQPATGKKLVVPGQRHEAAAPPDESPVQSADLASASRSCLAIIVILIALVLFACIAITIRGVFM